jgi:hypothetical protein
VAKKFIDNLDTLFVDDNVVDQVNHLENNTTQIHDFRNEISEEAPRILKKHKTFISDLDSLLNNERSNDNQQESNSSSNTAFKSLIGLENLIRQTSNLTETDIDYATTKRVTLMFDAKKLEQIKRIAKNQNRYMKDIINDALTSFLNNIKE